MFVGVAGEGDDVLILTSRISFIILRVSGSIPPERYVSQLTLIPFVIRSMLQPTSKSQRAPGWGTP